MTARKPGTPREPKPAKRTRITFGDGKADFQGRMNIQQGVRNTAPKSPKFSPEIKVLLDAWSASTDQAQAKYDAIIAAEASLEQMYGDLGNALLQVGLDRGAFATALENVCANADDARSFGANAVAQGTYAPPVPPVAIRQIATTVPGSGRVRWPSVPHAASYQAERSVDPPTASSWVACYTGSSPFFMLAGAPQERVWVRMCSVGKAPSAWSTPFLVILR